MLGQLLICLFQWQLFSCSCVSLRPHPTHTPFSLQSALTVLTPLTLVKLNSAAKQGSGCVIRIFCFPSTREVTQTRIAFVFTTFSWRRLFSFPTALRNNPKQQITVRFRPPSLEKAPGGVATSLANSLWNSLKLAHFFHVPESKLLAQIPKVKVLASSISVRRNTWTHAK